MNGGMRELAEDSKPFDAAALRHVTEEIGPDAIRAWDRAADVQPRQNKDLQANHPAFCARLTQAVRPREMSPAIEPRVMSTGAAGQSCAGCGNRITAAESSGGNIEGTVFLCERCNS